MKLLKFTLAVFIFTALQSCFPTGGENHDIVEGTPTNADTVLYNKNESQINTTDSVAFDEVPNAFRR